MRKLVRWLKVRWHDSVLWALLAFGLIAGATSLAAQQTNQDSCTLRMSGVDATAEPPYTVIVPGGPAMIVLSLQGLPYESWWIWASPGYPVPGYEQTCYGSVDILDTDPLCQCLISGTFTLLSQTVGFSWIFVPLSLHPIDLTMQMIATDPGATCGLTLSAAFHVIH